MKAPASILASTPLTMPTVALVTTAAVIASSLLACELPGAKPSRVPGDGSGAVLNVPYPMADPERVEGVGRQALADAQYVFISLGATPTDRDHALPERFEYEGPVLVAHHVDPGGPNARAWLPLRRLAFGRSTPPRGVAVAVDAVNVEELGLVAPAESVWLVGPRGTCRAHVGTPVIAAYDGADDTVMVGYQLEGCLGDGWAQIGIVAAAIPIDFRWVPAETTTEHITPHGGPWHDPLANVIEPPAWSSTQDPTLDIIRVREIPGAQPRVVQARYAWLAEPDDDTRPWCEVETRWSRTDGLFNDRWIDAIPWTADAVGPYMLGAFVNGSQVDAVIYDDRFDGLVVVPPGPLDDMADADAWTQVFVPTGMFDARTLEGWGAQPARGDGPVGAPCLLTEEAFDGDDGER